MVRAALLTIVAVGCAAPRAGAPAPAALTSPPTMEEPRRGDVAPGAPAAQASVAPRPCRALGIDWCNHVYGDELQASGPGGLTLADGDWESHLYACDGTPYEGEHVTFEFSLRSTASGDLDGDGVADALVTIDQRYTGCGNQGSFATTHLLAYAVHDGLVKPIANATVDRSTIAPTIANGLIERAAPNGCVDRWRVAGATLVQTEPHCAR